MIGGTRVGLEEYPQQFTPVIQPFVFFNLIKPWLIVFPISYLSMGLIALMNRLSAIPNTQESEKFLFSSA